MIDTILSTATILDCNGTWLDVRRESSGETVHMSGAAWIGRRPITELMTGARVTIKKEAGAWVLAR